MKNNLLAVAAGIVLIIGLMNLQQLYPLIERRGIEAGLLLLTITLLIPFATGKVSIEKVVNSLSSAVGIFAILGGLVGSYLNAQGIELLSFKPDIVPGILIGIVISVSFFGGVSVGPVMAAGITAILVSLLDK